MKAKELMAQVAESLKREDMLNEQLAYCQNRLNVKGVNFDSLPSSKNSGPGGIPDVLHSFYEVIEKIEEELFFSSMLFSFANEYLFKLEAEGCPADVIAAMRMKYICLKSWRDIGKACYMSPDHIRHKVSEWLDCTDDLVPVDAA